jgi:hypothetical protein
MDFANHKEETKKAGLGSNFFTCESGENKFRVLCLPVQIGTHYFDKEAGQDQIPPANCTMQDDCLYCAKKMKVNIQVQMYILDREDETIKLGKFPWSVYTGVGELQSSSEYGFEKLVPPPYDVIVTKSGQGQFGTKYETMPGRNSDPITAEQKAEFAEKKLITKIVEERVNKAREEQNAHKIADFEEEVKTEPVEAPVADTPLPDTPFN